MKESLGGEEYDVALSQVHRVKLLNEYGLPPSVQHGSSDG